MSDSGKVTGVVGSFAHLDSLLEAIAERDILARADPDDRDGDGISGRARFTTDPETGKRALGRLGWKADQPTVAAQAANFSQSSAGPVIRSSAMPLARMARHL